MTAPAVPTRLSVDEPVAAAYREDVRALREATPEERSARLADIARSVRRDIVTTIRGAGLGHIGGDLSVTDILVAAYWSALDVDPSAPDRPDRDRFVLSKGHCAVALYSVLAEVGFFPRSELGSFAQPLSPLNGHPNRVKVPGVETNTGPLGHGLPVATGCALAAKLGGRDFRTIVVMGDGEMQEGSNWEAIMTAAHYELHSLTAIVDRNRLQQGARTEDTKVLEPLDEKLTSFGFEARRIDGHDYSALVEALAPSTTGKPVAIVADTVKGKGVSFIEDRVEWHHKVPSEEQARRALEELGA
jgi:transketolase